MKNPEVEKNLIHCIKRYNKSNSLYWYPLVPIGESLDTAAYNIIRIYQDHRLDLLEAVVRACNIGNAAVFQMDHKEYFEDEDMIQLLYEQDEDGYIFPWYAETFVFDQSKEWLIYLSHEHTVSFTGEKIAAAARQIIPSCYLIA